MGKEDVTVSYVEELKVADQVQEELPQDVFWEYEEFSFISPSKGPADKSASARSSSSSMNSSSSVTRPENPAPQ